MLKNKSLLAIIIIAIMVFAIPTIANAAVEYTRTFPDNTGTIIINFKGLELDPTKPYQFSLVAYQADTPENWFNLDNGYTETTATITLSASTEKIKNVLKVVDEGFVYIRERDDTSGTYALERTKVNLKLPYLQSLVYTISDHDYGLVGAKLYGEIGNGYVYSGSDYTYVKWEKVTNENLIQAFLNIKNNEQEIVGLETNLPNPPTTGYISDRVPEYRDKNDGLYLLWVKRTGENCKQVFSCIVHDGLPNATTLAEYLGSNKPVVEKVEAIGELGTHDYTSTGWKYQCETGDEVSIEVTFDQEIVMNQSPVLTIKFGTGSNIQLTTEEVLNDKLTYHYTIKSADEGTLQIVSLTGGDVKNSVGDEADFTLPSISGDPVVAIKTSQQQPADEDQDISVESVTLNKTKISLEAGKEDTLVPTIAPSSATNKKVAYTTSDEKIAKVSADGVVTAVAEGTAIITVTTEDEAKTATCKVIVTKAATTGKPKDPTTTTTTIPDAGKTIGISITLLAIVALGTLGFVKYKKYKDV